MGSDLWASGSDVGGGEVHDGPLARGGRAPLHLRLSLRGSYLHRQVNGGEARRHGARRRIVVVHWSANRRGVRRYHKRFIAYFYALHFEWNIQIHLTISFLGKLQQEFSYCIVLCQG